MQVSMSAMGGRGHEAALAILLDRSASETPKAGRRRGSSKAVCAARGTSAMGRKLSQLRVESSPRILASAHRLHRYDAGVTGIQIRFLTLRLGEVEEEDFGALAPRSDGPLETVDRRSVAPNASKASSR